MANIKGTNQSDTLIGTMLKDHINGKKGNDSLFGMDGNDKLMGGDGDDYIYGGKGDDNIDGGKGIDTAFYTGNFADYLINLSGHNDLRTTVADQTSGRDGTDQLRNVEYLRFHDAIFEVANNVTHYSDHAMSGQELQSTGNPHPGIPWWSGGGVSPDHYNVADINAAHIELGLAFHDRNGSGVPFAPVSVDGDGTAHYTVPAGLDPTNAGRASWNFDYFVNTGLDGSAQTLSDNDFQMIITQTQGSSVHAAVFDLNASTHTWILEGPTPGGFGGDDFRSGTSPSPTVVSQVSENSENLAFINAAAGFGTIASATTAGTQYDFQLVASHQGQILGSTHDVLTLT
jgi:Ca2+-binding RTX toxin-like protein